MSKSAKPLSQLNQLWYMFDMPPRTTIPATLIAIVCLAASLARAQTPAPTPPMGWNSWDAYGLTINEEDFRSNAEVLAEMKKFGWEYALIDEGWYMENPFADKLVDQKYLWNKNGILIPVESRFPSAARNAGFKPLADWVHHLGLKFGIHLVRGIPKPVVQENLPIAGSSFRAADAADTTETCPWNDGNWGVKDNAAGQAYYDSMIKLYAGWGVDYLKVDCITDHPYRITEIRQIAEAIKKTGRPIVLSLSPGPTNLAHAAEVAQYAQMWRISDDHWDGWTFFHEGASEFPFGVRDAFDRLAAWNPYVRPGSWPDEDMLPWGMLAPHPGWGKSRPNRETPDEQRTEFTLWAIARSPLIVGANLTTLDDLSQALMTNHEILDINQKAVETHPIAYLPIGFEGVRVWEASMDPEGKTRYIALFNTDDKPVSLFFAWDQLGAAGKKTARNLWDGKKLAASQAVDLTLAPHASTIFRLE